MNTDHTNRIIWPLLFVGSGEEKECAFCGRDTTGRLECAPTIPCCNGCSSEITRGEVDDRIDAEYARQKRLAEKRNCVTCPNCQHKFDIRQQR